MSARTAVSKGGVRPEGTPAHAWLLRILLVLALVGIGAWAVSVTEWADTEVPTAARGEAKTNPLYATQLLLRELGMAVVQRDGLDAMPPAQARLVLASRHWNLFPARAQRLRSWVEQGGHLIVPGFVVDKALLDSWLPLVRDIPPRDEDDDDDEAPPPKTPAPPVPPKAARPVKPVKPVKPAKDADCDAVAEPDSVPASFAAGRGFRLCGAGSSARYKPSDKQPPALWSVRGPRGTEAVRVAVGRGTVTVVPWGLQSNVNLPRADNALFLAAALQARAGAEVWLVAEERREPFMRWIWQQGWVALLLGLLALAAALWRGAVRFGPLAPSAGTHRRSMAEQVRGTASFLQMHGAGALHAAQLRALQECAGRQLRHYARHDPAARAAAIARATGLNAVALARAMGPPARSAGTLAADLELLETARRRLDASGPAAAADPDASSSTP